MEDEVDALSVSRSIEDPQMHPNEPLDTSEWLNKHLEWQLKLNSPNMPEVEQTVTDGEADMLDVNLAAEKGR